MDCLMPKSCNLCHFSKSVWKLIFTRRCDFGFPVPMPQKNKIEMPEIRPEEFSPLVEVLLGIISQQNQRLEARAKGATLEWHSHMNFVQ